MRHVVRRPNRKTTRIDGKGKRGKEIRGRYGQGQDYRTRPCLGAGIKMENDKDDKKTKHSDCVAGFKP